MRKGDFGVEVIPSRNSVRELDSGHVLARPGREYATIDTSWALGGRGLGQERENAERVARDEIEHWRRKRLPDTRTSLGINDLVRLLRECLGALRLERSIASGVTVNTVHYYRRKDIIDPPVGNTASARYEVHHLWQVAGARLAGHLGLATLTEAREAMRGQDTYDALTYFATLVADARARRALRAANVDADVEAGMVAEGEGDIRPLPGVAAASTAPSGVTTPATIVALPGEAWCVVPAGHPAHRSPAAAEALARALVAALRTSHT